MNNDNQLIAKFVATKDKAAFAQLVRKHQSSIRQFLRRLTAGDHALADDLAQEAFLIMFQKLDTFSGNSALSTWLHKIAYNVYLGNLRKHKEHLRSDDILAHEVPSEPRDLEDDIAIEKLMERLDLDERLVMTLHYSAGMSHSEIVEVTGFPLGTIKSHINRAKTKLIKLVQPHESDAQGQQEFVA